MTPTTTTTGGCPVNHGEQQQQQPPQSPVTLPPTTPGEGQSCPVASGSACPARPATSCSSAAEARPDNLIPADISAMHSAAAGAGAPTPAPGGGEGGGHNTLSTHRQISSIPNAKGEAWVYPSQQQFFAALQRKQHHPFLTDMATVVPIHNAVNERAWAHILEWERVNAPPGGCPSPRLVKFEGRPKDYSPKARLLHLFGWVLPALSVGVGVQSCLAIRDPIAILIQSSLYHITSHHITYIHTRTDIGMHCPLTGTTGPWTGAGRGRWCT
jgi:cytochrome c heme-lyase